MSRRDSGHVRYDWTINISLDDHEGQARATALFRGRDKESVGVGVSRLDAAAAQDIETVTTRRDHVVATKPD
jgi:hypothetical protein